MTLSDITPMIITFNEEENIERVLSHVSWAKEVLVIDSFSTDRTLEICLSFKNVRIVQNPFKSFAEQCNFGLTHIQTTHVLSMDADYVLSEELIEEIKDLNDEQYNGFNIPFKYCVFGKPLRGTILPPRLSLYKKEFAHYSNDGHAHRVHISGAVGQLKHYILHDDQKPISRWLQSQDKYMVREIHKLYSGRPLSFSDRIRKKIFFAPLLVFFYCLFVKRGVLDGKKGWFYAYQRMLAESLLSIRIIEHLINAKKG